MCFFICVCFPYYRNDRGYSERHGGRSLHNRMLCLNIVRYVPNPLLEKDFLTDTNLSMMYEPYLVGNGQYQIPDLVAVPFRRLPSSFFRLPTYFLLPTSDLSVFFTTPERRPEGPRRFTVAAGVVFDDDVFVV